MAQISLLWLAAYFFNGLVLTIYNKAAMQFLDFKFPWALTGIHNLFSAIGCYFLYSSGAFKPARLSSRGNWIMIAFSFLYTINIAMSNVSLNLVTVPFHQIVRATTPVFVLFINVMWLKKFPAQKVLVSLIPTIFGVGIATYGDYYFTPYGFFLTVLGTVLSALKGVVTNQVQVGELKLHPMDLLMRMAPLACVQTFIASWWTGELEKMGHWEWDWFKVWVLVGNGVLAFSMNLVSFTANKKTSALTMGVAGNVKQVLSIVIAVLVFSLRINLVNGLGILVTLFGGAYYSAVDLQLRQARLPSHVQERNHFAVTGQPHQQSHGQVMTVSAHTHGGNGNGSAVAGLGEKRGSSPRYEPFVEGDHTLVQESGGHTVQVLVR